MLNPELCLIEQQSAANRCTVWMCVCDWVNVKLYCKELWVVIKTRKALYKYKSIYHLLLHKPAVADTSYYTTHNLCFPMWSDIHFIYSSVSANTASLSLTCFRKMCFLRYIQIKKIFLSSSRCTFMFLRNSSNLRFFVHKRSSICAAVAAAGLKKHTWLDAFQMRTVHVLVHVYPHKIYFRVSLMFFLLRQMEIKSLTCDMCGNSLTTATY